MSKKTFFAISALIGTIIGAGFLGIPYIVMKSGFGIGLLHLIFIALAVAITMLYMGEIVSRTKKTHQLAGYAEKYLGKKGKIWMNISVIFGIYSALIAYLIGEGNSLSYLFFGTTNYTLHFGIMLWAILSLISYFGLKILEKEESVGIIIIFLILISITFLFWNKIDINNLSYNNSENFLAPFGVILFSFLGFSIVPEIKRILGKEKAMKRVIISGYAVALFVYILFTVLVLGTQGKNTPEIATLALGKPFILLGIITMFNAYLALSTALTDSFRLDMKKSKKSAWLYTISVPIVLFIILNIIQKAEFTNIIGIGGAITGTIAAILILLMAEKAKLKGDKKPDYAISYSKILAVIITIIFLIGTVFEIINAFE